MDYAIFLVDRFEEIRREGYEAIDAMSIAVSKSAASILSDQQTDGDKPFGAVCPACGPLEGRHKRANP